MDCILQGTVILHVYIRASIFQSDRNLLSAVPSCVDILTDTGPTAPSVFSSTNVTIPWPSLTEISVSAKLIFMTKEERSYALMI